MKAVIAVLVGLMLSAPAVAESLIEGWVRRSSGEPVEAAQVRVFDWTNLQRGVVAQATTDATGYFALPLKSLGGSARPQAWTLGQNYPNPFNPSTIIPYHLPTVGRVRLEVFNVLGQRIATLVDGERPSGVHTAMWDATDVAGRAVGAGVYFYRFRSVGQPTLTRRMVLVDGQAGQAAASVPLPLEPSSVPAAERVYGLAVTGAGLVTYVDASFGVRAGMAAVEVEVDAVAGLPRGKALTDRVLGDVNGDGQVNLSDALLVMTYVVDGFVAVPANGDISLGDVNGDGLVDLSDALLVMTYVVNPADGSLPAGIGQAVPSSGEAWVAGAIRNLTNSPAWDEDPVWSPDGRHLAFMSRRDGNDELYVMDSDGSNLRRLTDDSAWDRYPVWSPDGRHLAFTSLRDGNSELYVMDSDGSNLRRLTDDSAWDEDPVWSPDGRHLAFTSLRDGNSELYVMDSDGSNPRNLTNSPAWDGYPVWSPDGRHLAFESARDGNSELYVMDSDGSNLRRLTNSPAPDGYPVWSPDGRHLAFMSDFNVSPEIYVMDSDGSNPRNLTNSPAWDGYPVWSPDGRHLAFESARDGNFEIYVMDSDGSNPRRLTDDSAWDRHPSWSPDGRHLAFESARDGNVEIYVMELREARAGSSETPLSDGDSPETAIPLAVGESIEGELSADDSDYFRVTVSSPGTLVASTTGSTDTYGHLEDSSGNVLSMDDDGGEGRNFLVSAAVEPGTYYVRVRGFDTSTTGVYTLTLQMEEGSDGSGGDWVAGAIRLLTDASTRNGGHPSWSPDGRHIAFMSYRDDNQDIYVMDSDGSNPRRLTHHSAGDGHPSWSPDGRHIAFTSYRDDNLEIYVMDSDGSNPRRLTHHSADDFLPSWSPDGRHIAFMSDRAGNLEIYVMDSDGSNLRNLTDHSAWDGEPSWSPDGRHIAFTSGRAGNLGIYVMDSDGSNLRNLTNDSADDFSPAWSPDGRHIAFVSDRAGNSEIYVMDSDGSNPRRLTAASTGYYPSWSPDGRHIAFHYGDPDGNLEIYVMELREAGSGETSLDDGDTTETATPPVEPEPPVAALTPEIVGLYGTLVNTFTNIFFAALVPGTTSVLGEGGGSVEISGNDWTLQDYSPDGELIANGALNIDLTQSPIPMSGEVTLSGSHEAELILDMQLSVGADGLSATGTITINGAEFNVAEVSAAAAAAAEAAAAAG